MKTATKKPYDYAKLRRAIFIKAIIITACAVATVLLFRSLSRGHFADMIVDWIARILSTDRSSASVAYFNIIPNNIEFIIAVIIIAFMFLLFGILLKSYTKYFDEVVSGIDRLTDNEPDMIALSPELESIENKLNNVRQALEERAQKARKAESQKNDLVVYLAHDIKTPLTSVIGYLSLLDETKDLPDAKKSEYIHIALDKAGRLETLVNEFFEITRYSLQSVQLNKEVINYSFLMAQLMDELYPALCDAGKVVTSDFDDELTLYGDAEKLARVFNNILKNAIVYSDERSVIRVFAERKLEKTIIRVESEGSVSADKLEAIFDKFNRLNSARSSETGGAGLGLAIARDIVTAHGGNISAESDETHTVFVVELPAVDLMPS